MSDPANKLSSSSVQQLSEFEQRLLRSLDDQDVLAEVHASIQRLVDRDDGCEIRIREILRNRLDAGDIRAESVELVQRMLDRMCAEAGPGEEPDGLALVDDSPPADATLELALVDDSPPAEAVADAANDGAAEPAADAEPAVEIAAPPSPPPTRDDPRAYKAGSGPLQSGSLLGGRFLLGKQMPAGIAGTIFQAVDERLADAGRGDARFGIQVLPPETAASNEAIRVLQQEIAKGRCLKHPNIVRFIDLGQDEDLHYVVTEKIEGKSLATILEDASQQDFDKELALDIVSSVANALEFAHQRGVVHGDVQPGNIMIDPGGEVKLFNFGMARVRQQSVLDAGGSNAGDPSAGSASYSSMQVLTGEEPAVSDDVFGLGCLMYRLVAGYRVFGPRNAADAAEAGMEPQKLNDLENAQWLALKRSLAYSRIPRFPSCAEFMAALGGLVRLEDEIDEEAENATATVETLAMAPRSVPWALVVAGVVLIAAGAAFFLASGMPAGDPAGPQPAAAAGPSAIDPGPDEGATAVDAAAEPAQAAQTEADFAAMLPPTLTVGLVASGQYVQVVDLTLREGGDAATIDVVRMRNILEPYAVVLEEVEAAGEHSEPLWGTGQFSVSDNGELAFAAGQSRTRVTLSMPGDELREQDTEVTLRIRDADDEDSELALIRVRLEDDDQRLFEAGLPPNTFGFAASSVTVGEDAPAVQIDVLRFQPDNEPASVSYVVRDISAAAGADYFPPEEPSVFFARGQRTARILIPLVQDADVEADESFTLELVGISLQQHLDTYQRIAVMIRDDD